MSILGREDLRRALHEPDLQNRLIVTPLDADLQLGCGGIDLRLSTEFLVLRRTGHASISPQSLDQSELAALYERVVVPFGDQIWLHPRHLILAASLEFVALPENLCGTVSGRSSWGRLGLIPATAVFVHPGFRGCLTLELVNEGNSPIPLMPGSRVAQLTIARTESPAPRYQGDSGKYIGSVRPQPSQLAADHGEFDRLQLLGKRLRSRLG